MPATYLTHWCSGHGSAPHRPCDSPTCPCDCHERAALARGLVDEYRIHIEEDRDERDATVAERMRWWVQTVGLAILIGLLLMLGDPALGTEPCRIDDEPGMLVYSAADETMTCWTPSRYDVAYPDAGAETPSQGFLRPSDRRLGGGVAATPFTFRSLIAGVHEAVAL